jgi:hypothetical protein
MTNAGAAAGAHAAAMANAAKQRSRIEMGRMGINSASPRYAGLLREENLTTAAMAANAATAAANAAHDTSVRYGSQNGTEAVTYAPVDYRNIPPAVVREAARGAGVKNPDAVGLQTARVVTHPLENATPFVPPIPVPRPPMTGETPIPDKTGQTPPNAGTINQNPNAIERDKGALAAPVVDPEQKTIDDLKRTLWQDRQQSWGLDTEGRDARYSYLEGRIKQEEIKRQTRILKEMKQVPFSQQNKAAIADAQRKLNELTGVTTQSSEVSSTDPSPTEPAPEHFF